MPAKGREGFMNHSDYGNSAESRIRFIRFVREDGGSISVATLRLRLRAAACGAALYGQECEGFPQCGHDYSGIGAATNAVRLALVLARANEALE